MCLKAPLTNNSKTLQPFYAHIYLLAATVARSVLKVLGLACLTGMHLEAMMFQPQ
jgi:hypothetical protein